MSSRVRALRVYLWLAAVPAALFLLTLGWRYGGLLSVMWVVLVLTIGFAATSSREQQPNTYDPRGRLHG